jgi:hypothetical protein
MPIGPFLRGIHSQVGGSARSGFRGWAQSFLGPVVAEFEFQNRASIKIKAAAVECSVFGPSEFVESLQP